MDFSQTIGNTALKDRLQQSVAEGKIPHAQLFVGPKGTGKLQTAIAYAAQVLALDHPIGEKVKNLQHADLHFAFPVTTNENTKSKPISDNFMTEWRSFVQTQPYGELFDWYQHLGIENKQGNIGVDEAESIVKKLSLKSYEGGYKIMIIWGAGQMNTAASNKLLKIIEEPPAKTVFILITEQEEDVLQTIRSRTQLVQFKRITDNEIAESLQKKYQISENKALELAHEAQGDYNIALKLAHQNIDNEFEAYFVDWIRNSFMAKTRPQVLKNLVHWANEINAWGREKQKKFLEYATQVFRQALLANYQANDLTFMELSHNSFNWQKFAPYIHGANIEDILEELSEASYHIERNANAKIVFLDVSIKITRYLHRKT